jgi:hypothetical protein
MLTMSQIVNPKGEMKGSAITGPVGKEAAELWPVRQAPKESPAPLTVTAYRQQLRRRHVNALRTWFFVRQASICISRWDCCGLESAYKGQMIYPTFQRNLSV